MLARGGLVAGRLLLRGHIGISPPPLWAPAPVRLASTAVTAGGRLSSSPGPPPSSSPEAEATSSSPSPPPPASPPSTVSPGEHPLGRLTRPLTPAQRFYRARAAATPPRTYTRSVDGQGRSRGTGRRKAAVAQVVLSPHPSATIDDSSGNADGGEEYNGVTTVTINGRRLADYFPRADHRAAAVAALVTAGGGGGGSPGGDGPWLGAVDVVVRVAGGGSTGQAEAVRLGLARAVLAAAPATRGVLKADGLLTRDARVVEEKKYGRKKARRSFQWVKR